MAKIEKYKKRIFDIIQIGSREDIPSTIFDIFIVCMIILSIAVTFLETFDEFASYKAVMDAIELFTILVFMVEYILRIWTSEYLYPDCGKGEAVNRFLFSFYGIVDFLTIVSYFSVLYSNGAIVLRMIRVVRILRLFKVNQSFDAFNVLAEVLKEKLNQIISSLFMIFMLMLGASLCMYGFEHEAQPEVFDNAFSGMWWAMSTVLTVGYGDMYPITLGGRVAAILIALLGVCVVAIPTGVISAGFVEYYARLRTDEVKTIFAPDVCEMLQKQARARNISVNTYMERLILEQEWRELEGGSPDRGSLERGNAEHGNTEHGKKRENAGHRPSAKRKKK
ncbi:MAG: ion transporter [Lachnospiraceae bacterium]|nr:ion transporter [Lachnospiraceae bacterium]